MKRFLIIASMVCLLVSSLVVVSFADSYSKYDYQNYVDMDFRNLSESNLNSVYSTIIARDIDAYCVIETDGGSYEFAYDSITVWSGTVSSDHNYVYYQFSQNNNVRYFFQFLYDLETGEFSKGNLQRVNELDQTVNLFDFNSYADLVLYYNGNVYIDAVDNDYFTVTKGLVEDPHSPSYLLSLLFTGFGTAIGGLALGIKESLSNVIWVDPSATERTLSPLVIFIFTIAGLGIGMTVFYMVFRLIRFGRQR